MLEPQSCEEENGPILLIQRFDEQLVGPRAMVGPTRVTWTIDRARVPGR